MRGAILGSKPFRVRHRSLAFAFFSPKHIHEDRSSTGPIQMDPFDFSASGKGQPRGQEVRMRKEPFVWALSQFKFCGDVFRE